MKTIKPSSSRKGGSAFGNKIIAGLREFNRELAQGRPLSDFYTRRQPKLNLEPREHNADSVRAIRETLHVSQAIFAQILGASLPTVQAWEQGKHAPPKMARRLLDEIALNPQRWTDLLQKAYQRKGA